MIKFESYRRNEDGELELLGTFEIVVIDGITIGLIDGTPYYLALESEDDD